MTVKNTKLCAPRSLLRILVDFVGAGALLMGLTALVVPRVQFCFPGYAVKYAFGVFWLMFCGSTVGLAFLSSGPLSVTVAGAAVYSFIFVASPHDDVTFLHLAIEIAVYGLGVLLPFRMQAMQASEGVSQRGALRSVWLPALVLGIAVALFLWRYQTPMGFNPPIFAPLSPTEESTLSDGRMGCGGSC